MKHARFSIPFFIISCLTFATSCTEEEQDGCQDTIMPPIEGRFNVKAQVTYNDGVAYTDYMRMSIFKKYCDGAVSGDFEQTGETDSTGYWNPQYQYTYKFDNLDDKVTIAWYVDGPSGLTRATWEEFYYEDVSSSNYYIDKTFIITLPWDSTP